MELFAITGFVVLVTLAFIVILYREQREKEYRSANGLPARKYHDITDQDVTIVHTIQHK